MIELSKGVYQNINLVHSISDYITMLESIADKMGSNRSSLWYRGAAKSTYELVPSIMRKDDWKEAVEGSSENSIYSDFVHKARPLVNGPYTNSRWYWYVVAQHYGLPTRLLDWSTGALIALHFAIWEKDATSPTVWVLDPFRMNEESTGTSLVFFADEVTSDDEDKNIQEKYIYNSSQLPKYPIAIIPSFVDERIRAQRGTFTVSGTMKSGFHVLARNSNKPFLAKIRISSRAVSKMRDELIQLGFGPFDIYPDLSGLCKSIKFEWNL